MIDHASANCKHAASARAASGTHANHVSIHRLHTSACQHLARHRMHTQPTAKQGMQLPMPATTRPSTLSTRHLSPARPWPHCHMPQRGRRCRSGRKLPTTQRAAVGRGTLSKAGTPASHQAVMARPYRAGLVRAGQQRRRSVAIRDLQAALDTCRRAQKSERASRPLRVVAGGRAPRP